MLSIFCSKRSQKIHVFKDRHSNNKSQSRWPMESPTNSELGYSRLIHLSRTYISALLAMRSCSFDVSRNPRLRPPEAKVLIIVSVFEQWLQIEVAGLTFANPYKTWMKFGSIGSWRERTDVKGTALGSPESKVERAYTSSLIKWSLCRAQKFAMAASVSGG